MHRFLCALVFASFLLFVRDARADEIAPTLEPFDLREKASVELKKIVGTLSAADKKKLTGIYAAFHPESGDPFALAACDDDGDYVVVLSDAMLRLASNVARAQSQDDAAGTRTVEDYARFLAQTQVKGRRLLPPPPGTFTSDVTPVTYDDRLEEILSFVVAREVMHLVAGQLVCAHPTATKEAGDTTWTAEEHRSALANVATIYPGQPGHDEDAVAHVLAAGHMELGALALLLFFEQYEAEPRVRFAPSYRELYPRSVARRAAVKSAAEHE